MALLRRLIGHVDSFFAAQSGALTDITPAQLSRALVFWRGLRNLQEAAEMLDVSSVQVKGLIEEGVLDAIRFGTALRYVFASDLERLLADVHALPDVPHVGTVFPLRDHCRNHRIALVRLITLWHDGKAKGFARSADEKGLQAIRVLQDVDAGLCKNAISRRDLTPLETAAHLKIGVGAIRALRDAGYLRHTKCLNTDTNHRHSLITRSSIREFEERFLTLGQLAAASKIAPIHLARRLDREGVPTVDCGSWHVRAYER